MLHCAFKGFPMAEVISHRIPIGWYEGFYLYLYMGSILFLIFVYLFLLHRPKKPKNKLHLLMDFILRRRNDLTSDSESERKSRKGSSTASDEEIDLYGRRQCGIYFNNSMLYFVVDKPFPSGSFYLRLGAVAFGIGSMIYSGLEFGQFFELESKEHCYNFLYGFTPGSHVAFTFIQLYFIFMNSRVVISRHKLIGTFMFITIDISRTQKLFLIIGPKKQYFSLARFGLMHMIATNLCVWLHVLIQETKHQIMILVNPNVTELMPDFSIAWEHVNDVVEEISEDYLESINLGPVNPESHHISKRSLDDHSLYTTHGECRRSNVIGQLVQDASQFLFPCTIEYSLICAAILYIMWKSFEDERYILERKDFSKD